MNGAQLCVFFFIAAHVLLLCVLMHGPDIFTTREMERCTLYSSFS